MQRQFRDAVVRHRYPLDKTFSDEAPCQAFADGETAAVIQNSLGCRTDWGTGLCNTWEVTPDSTGCAVYFEGLMNGKLYPNGWMLLATVGVEGMTIIMVTHDPKIADHCQRVVTLEDGLVATDRATSHDVPTD